MSVFQLVEIVWFAAVINSAVIMHMHQSKMEKLLGRRVDRYATIGHYFMGTLSLVLFAPMISLTFCTEAGSRYMKLMLARVVSTRPQNNVTREEETMLLKWADE